MSTTVMKQNLGHGRTGDSPVSAPGPVVAEFRQVVRYIDRGLGTQPSVYSRTCGGGVQTGSEIYRQRTGDSLVSAPGPVVVEFSQVVRYIDRGLGTQYSVYSRTCGGGVQTGSEIYRQRTGDSPVFAPGPVVVEFRQVVRYIDRGLGTQPSVCSRNCGGGVQTGSEIDFVVFSIVLSQIGMKFNCRM